MELTGDSRVDHVYAQVKSLTISYQIKPGERLNEIELAHRFRVSRTPLREALNRLKTEELLRFVPGKGFFCRELDVKEIFDLYQLRKAIEIAAVRLTARDPSLEEIQDLRCFLSDTGPEIGDRSIETLVDLDENFHERLMAMSGNKQMLRVLHNVNARIRFIRWIDMDRSSRPVTQAEHQCILDHLEARDDVACIAALERHIDRRLDQINAAIKEGYAQIYMVPTAFSPVAPVRSG